MPLDHLVILHTNCGSAVTKKVVGEALHIKAAKTAVRKIGQENTEIEI